MAASRAAWLRALRDVISNSSNRRSWKGSGVVISSAGAFHVSSKIAKRGENAWLWYVFEIKQFSVDRTIEVFIVCD